MRMPRLSVFVLVWVLAIGVPAAVAAASEAIDDPAQQATTSAPPPAPGGALGGVVEGLPPRSPSVPPSQMPPRDRRPVPRTGTSSLRGRVVDALTGQPLVHAQVRLNGTGRNTTIVTDVSGLFAFGGLPGGRYFVWASKPGYIGASFPLAGRTLRAASGLDVADGQVLENVTVPLYRGSAISGRVVDAYGDPVENAMVQVVPAPGSRGLRSFSGGGANDAGEFRIGRLDAGSYLLVATPQNGRVDSETDQTAPVPTYYPGVLTPDQAQPVTVERGQTLTGIDFQVLDQAVTTVTGSVVDAAGQLASGGNVSVQNAVGNRQNFRGGSPLRPDGTFELKLPPGDYRLMAYVHRREPSADGTKAAAAPARPAQYDNQPQIGTLRLTVGSEALSNVVINTGDGGTISGRLVFDGDGPPPDLARLAVTAQSRRAAWPTRWIDGSFNDECRASRTGKLNADMTFAIEGVSGTCVINIASGDGRWRPRSAIYRGADLLDRPVEIQNNQSVRDVPIVLSTRRTDLSAEVSDDQGAATQEYVMLAFSTEKARWPLQRYIAYSAGAPPSAARASGSPTPAGAGASFGSGSGAMEVALAARSGSSVEAGLAMQAVLAGPGIGTGARRPGAVTTLPAGDYYVVAVDDAAFDDLQNPAFLEQLVPAATRVTLRDGEPQKVQLRRIKAPAGPP
jgi:hypothetical protein